MPELLEGTVLAQGVDIYSGHLEIRERVTHVVTFQATVKRTKQGIKNQTLWFRIVHTSFHVTQKMPLVSIYICF